MWLEVEVEVDTQRKIEKFVETAEIGKEVAASAGRGRDCFAAAAAEIGIVVADLDFQWRVAVGCPSCDKQN